MAPGRSSLAVYSIGNDQRHHKTVIAFAARGLHRRGADPPLGGNQIQHPAHACTFSSLLAGFDHVSLADHVVDNDQAAAARELEGPAKIVGIARLVGVDKDQIERTGSFGRQFRQRFQPAPAAIRPLRPGAPRRCSPARLRRGAGRSPASPAGRRAAVPGRARSCYSRRACRSPESCGLASSAREVAASFLAVAKRGPAESLPKRLSAMPLRALRPAGRSLRKPGVDRDPRFVGHSIFPSSIVCTDPAACCFSAARLPPVPILNQLHSISEPSRPSPVPRQRCPPGYTRGMRESPEPTLEGALAGMRECLVVANSLLRQSPSAGIRGLHTRHP